MYGRLILTTFKNQCSSKTNGHKSDSSPNPSDNSPYFWAEMVKFSCNHSLTKIERGRGSVPPQTAKKIYGFADKRGQWEGQRSGAKNHSCRRKGGWTLRKKRKFWFLKEKWIEGKKIGEGKVMKRRSIMQYHYLNII